MNNLLPLIVPNKSVNVTLIPDSLKKLSQWVSWRYETRDGKKTKIPYQINGLPASSTDAETWASFEGVVKTYQDGGYDGIGFVVTPTDKYCGIDLDHCRNPETGEIEPDKLQIIKSLNSYTEITPSLTGVRSWIKAKIPEGSRKRDDLKHIEIYDQSRFFTVTGNHLDGTPTTIDCRQDQLEALLQSLFPPKPATKQPVQQPVSLDDQALLSKAFEAKNGDTFKQLWQGDTSAYNGDDSRADLALCSMLAFWTANDPARMDTLFRQSGLYRDKWERKDYREHTIQKAIAGKHDVYKDSIYIGASCQPLDTDHYESITKSITKTPSKKETITNLSAEKIEEWVTNTSGWFSTDELDRDLGISSPDDKNIRRVTLFRLKEQTLEKHQSQNKLWRRIDNKARLIDFKNIGLKPPLDLRFPFDIHKLVNLYPKSIVIVAGATESGKTAFLLNFIRLNMDRFSIYYFSSEMGETELSLRLSKFKGIELQDWKFTAEERSSNFADVIRPDCINIIDFLEICQDFNEIAGQIRQIYDKLGQSGVAIIAIQKNADVDLGRGGTFSEEKARLYLSMDHGVTKIVKGKNWANPEINPRNCQIKYKIVQGCQYKLLTSWCDKEGNEIFKPSIHCPVCGSTEIQDVNGMGHCGNGHPLPGVM